MNQKLLLTGGTGYIGSHTCVQLLALGYEVTLLDNLSNSSVAVLDRIATITGKRPHFVQADLLDTASLLTVLGKGDFDAVMHFAGLKAVAESVAQPQRYYRNNVVGTLNLLTAMEAADVKTLVFSSSATVYGAPVSLPIPETAALGVTNPYGRTKLIVEQLLQDTYAADTSWRIACLRYFNPVGAHASGLLGESPRGIPNNLMPYISQVAIGKRPVLSVYGNDYPTPDGTGVRDYIHVLDLADGHVAALKALGETNKTITVNLGSGRGYSVLEVVAAFARAAGKPIPYQFLPRRDGDIAQCYADTQMAAQLLQWQTRLGLDRMCEDCWRWMQQNPNGLP
jgi:UDP-glucose 4-epimerase